MWGGGGGGGSARILLNCATMLDFQNLRELKPTPLVAISTLSNLPLLVKSKMATIVLTQNRLQASTLDFFPLIYLPSGLNDTEITASE